MQRILLKCSLLMIAFSWNASNLIAQLKITKLKKTDWEDVAESHVVGFTKAYLKLSDLKNDRNAVFLEFSRHYYQSQSDTMFARLNINGNDVDFFTSTNSRFDYHSRKGTYKIKMVLDKRNDRVKLLVYKKKLERTIFLFSKSYSG